MTGARSAAALIIGNEILSGKIADANLQVLARSLRDVAVRLDRVVIVPDELALISREVGELSASRDFVFTSGGVGPTHDDVTVDAVADAFRVPVVVAAQMEAVLRSYYGERLTAGHLRMARVPEGARLIQSPDVPWPSVVMRNVWILPGIPPIFALKMDAVRSELACGQCFVSRSLKTKLDEGALKPLLDRVVAAHPDVEIGSYPQWREPRYKTKLTFDSLEATRAEAACSALLALLAPDDVVTLEE